MKVTVSSKGQILLPAPIRKRDHIVAGQQFELQRLESGQYLLQRQPVVDNVGVVDWLLSCPSVNWFQQLHSDSTGC